MRDRETIESELRRIAARGAQPSSREADELLDELLAHSAGIPSPAPVATGDFDYIPDAWLRETRRETKTEKVPPRRRKGAVRRFGLVAALPLSLVALVAAVVVMVAMRHHDSSAQSAEAQPTEASPSAAPPQPVAPKAPGPRADVVDMAFVEALKHEGVPVPSQEYVVAQGHAVCDFLTRQRNFADAVGFVQRSSIWDANQSTDVTAGAIISYCPQSRPSMADEVQQPAYQNTLSDLQAIEGKLQGIQDDLHGIQGGLDNLPGHP
ncbi:DUF732 domain-containing protein [Mycobacterium lentiflavum]|nr:DUF732 domain-containing protein [Mycobacterium lentiflavum]